MIISFYHNTVQTVKPFSLIIIIFLIYNVIQIEHSVKKLYFELHFSFFSALARVEKKKNGARAPVFSFWALLGRTAIPTAAMVGSF